MRMPSPDLLWLASLVSYWPLAELSPPLRVEASPLTRIAINPKKNQCVCRLYEEVLCTMHAGAGGIDENSLRAFTLSMKGTPLLLGRGAARALLTLGAYKVAQIWWSRRLRLHS